MLIVNKNFRYFFIIFSFFVFHEFISSASSSRRYTLEVINGEGSGDYQRNEKIIVTANSAPSGYIFENWSGDTDYISSSNEKITEVTMPIRNIQLTANYISKTQDPKPEEEITYSLNVENGEGSGDYLSGDKIIINAENKENEDLIFYKWEGDVSFIEDVFQSDVQITVPKRNLYFKATYKEIVIEEITNQSYLSPIPTVPGALEAENFDIGGQTVAYYDSTPENFGDFRNEESVDTYTINNNEKIVGYTNEGEWVKYSFESSKAQTLYLSIVYSTALNNSAIEIRINENKVYDLALQSTGNWRNYKNKFIGQVSLVEGINELEIYFAKAGDGSEFVIDVDKFILLESEPEPEIIDDSELYPMSGLVWMEARPAGSTFGLKNPIIMALSGKASNSRNYKIIHPWYNPFKSPMNESQIRNWARSAVCNEKYEGVGLDHEGWTLGKGPEMLRYIYEEAKKCGGYFISVPKINLDHHASLKIWNGERDYNYKSSEWINLDSTTKDRLMRKTVEYFEKYTDGISPWIYNFKAEQYYAWHQKWKQLGYTKQIWPMGDDGYRPGYGGINSSEATRTVNFLADKGISFGIFNPKNNNAAALNAMRNRLKGQ